MKSNWSSAAIVAAAAMLIGACAEVSTEPKGPLFKKNSNSSSATYLGQGFTYDGTTWLITNQRCGGSGEDVANDGGTGQFANWNGTGEPYEEGQPYLLWVLTANGATAPVYLNLPTGQVTMYAVGGTYKYASQYWEREDLLPPEFTVTATFGGSANNAQLVVSHGCPGFVGGTGAWCSPGYWRNARDAAWTLIGHDPATNDIKGAFFDPTVSSFAGLSYTGNTILLQAASLTTVLGDASTYSGPTIGIFSFANALASGGFTTPQAMNAFNATGAYLTNLIPDYYFDPLLIGTGNACPIDNHGRLQN